MENPYGLRLARPDDFEPLLAFVLQAIRDDAVQPVSVTKVSALVARCIERSDAVAGIVSGPKGIEASVGASVEEFEYTDEKHLSVRWLGVAPAFRQTDLPARLMKYVEWLHQSTGDLAMPVFMSALTTSDQFGKVSLLERKAPRVGVIHAYGCLPDRSFLPTHARTPTHVRKKVIMLPRSDSFAGPIAKSA